MHTITRISLAVCTLLLCINNPVGAQALPDVQWITGSPVKLAYNTGITQRMAVSGKGSVFLALSFSDSLIIDSQRVISSGGNDLCVAKYDQGGRLLWLKSFGGPWNESQFLITTDDSDNCFVACTFSGTIHIADTTYHTTDWYDNTIALFKLDAAGTVQWSRQIKAEYPGGLTWDGSGDIVLAGTMGPKGVFNGQDTLTAMPCATPGETFIAKYRRADGGCDWARTSKGYGMNCTALFVQPQSGDIYLKGTYGGKVNIAGLSKTDAAYYTGLGNTYTLHADSLASAGKWISTINCNTPNLNSCGAQFGIIQSSASLVADGVGNVYEAFAYSNCYPIISGSAGLINSQVGNDMLFIKYDKNGHIAWAKSMGAGVESASSLVLDKDGNLVLYGTFGYAMCVGADTLREPNSGHAVFLAKFDTSGNPLSAYSPKGFATGSCIGTDGAGNLYVSGITDGTKLTFGNRTIKPGSWGFYLAKIMRTSTGVIDAPGPEANPAVYPNPATDYCSVRFNAGHSFTRISITDALGRSLMVYPIVSNNQNTISLCTAGWAEGLYTILCTGNGKSAAAKLIVRH